MTMSKKSAIGMTVVIPVFLALLYMRPDSGDELTQGVPHQFRSMQKITIELESGNSVEALQLSMTPTQAFAAPLQGPRGERLVQEDPSLEPNTFILERKLSPAVILSDGRSFQDSFTYILVRYNPRTKAPQNFVPHFERNPEKPPENK
jgi:hypothetical protein